MSGFDNRISHCGWALDSVIVVNLLEAPEIAVICGKSQCKCSLQGCRENKAFQGTH